MNRFLDFSKRDLAITSICVSGLVIWTAFWRPIGTNLVHLYPNPGFILSLVLFIVGIPILAVGVGFPFFSQRCGFCFF